MMDNILSVRNLSIQIKQRPLINNIYFDVKTGDALLLSGENGMGKSSILKSIMGLESSDKSITGEIIYSPFGNVLELDSSSMQDYRSKIAYIPQRDDYSEMGNIQVRDVFSESNEAHFGRGLSISAVNEIIDEWIPRRSDNSRVFDAKSKPAKFSGGEQRLLSVLSVVATRKNTNLMIIDEPLNNLDFANARNISNLINRVLKENPKMGLLMVSHCRIFPFISREIKLTADGIIESFEPYTCHSCIGEADSDGYYCL